MPLVRLDKYLSDSLVISRKDASNLVKSGCVKIDGKTAKKADIKLDTDKNICEVNGKELKYSQFLYFMLNKPQGLVCAASDARDKTVLSLFDKSYLDKGLFTCGRLDKDTVGLLILTTDGETSHKLLSPKNHAQKLYFVRADKPFTQADVTLMNDGIVMDGKKTKPAILDIDENDSCCAKITLTEGKYHEIKRLCYACGQKEVTYLKRLSFAGLTLDESLEEGQYRELTEKEIAILKA